LEFPTDIVQTGIAQSTFELVNPFTASINILTVTATAVYRNLTLGKINNVDLSSNPVHANGHSTVTSQSIPLQYNLDPATTVELLLDTSSARGVNLGPLPGLFAIALENPNFKSAITTTVDTKAPTCVSGKQFDVDDAILNSLKGLEVTLEIDSSTAIDDYHTDLVFNQYNVSAVTDKTALYLIGAVAKPITQALVNQAELSFKVANIS
jgi:hypothetical protein